MNKFLKFKYLFPFLSVIILVCILFFKFDWVKEICIPKVACIKIEPPKDKSGSLKLKELYANYFDLDYKPITEFQYNGMVDLTTVSRIDFNLELENISDQDVVSIIKKISLEDSTGDIINNINGKPIFLESEPDNSGSIVAPNNLSTFMFATISPKFLLEELNKNQDFTLTFIREGYFYFKNKPEKEYPFNLKLQCRNILNGVVPQFRIVCSSIPFEK